MEIDVRNRTGITNDDNVDDTYGAVGDVDDDVLASPMIATKRLTVTGGKRQRR